MTLYRRTYRVESARLQGWDYGSAAWYFVTICTRNRYPWFGNVVDREMQVSVAGEIATEEWLRSEQLRSHVVLDTWVVMPNHLHGVIGIVPDEQADTDVTMPAVRWRNPTGIRAGSLGAVIGQFKTVSTKRIRASFNPEFGWQSRFHDHIIRSDRSLDRIRDYIAANPLNWHHDSLYARQDGNDPTA